MAYLVLQDQVHIVGVQLRVLCKDLLGPLGMLLQGLGVLCGGQVRHQHISKVEQLLLQAAGQHGQTHHLDETDVLLFDVVQFSMGMVHAQRMLRSGDVVAQHQIQLILAVPHPGDGGNGVVGLTIRLGKDKAAFIGVAAPGSQQLIGQLYKACVICTGQTDAAHGPVHDAGLHILKAGEHPRLFNRCFGHGELVMTALEVVVAQDAAAHDRQVGVAAHKIVGEQTHKIQQLAEGCPLDLHGCMLVIEHDAVLVVVNVGAVLQIPCAVVDGQRDDAVVFARGVVHAACVALVLHAQLTLGVSALGCKLCGGNGLGVFFRLGQVDGDIQVAVLGLGDPLQIALDTVAADVVGVLTELVEPVGGGLRALVFVPLLKVCAHNAGARGKHAHQLGVEQIACGGVILAHAAGNGIVHKGLEDAFQIGIAHLALRGGKVVQLHGHQQLVADIDLVIRQNQPGVQPVVHELLDGSRDHSTAPPSGRMLSTWQRPAPRIFSMFALKSASISTGTKACTVPAKPPPCTRTAPLPPR